MKKFKKQLINDLGQVDFDNLNIIGIKMEEFLKKDTSSCRLYRIATTPYLKHIEKSPISSRISSTDLKSEIDSVTIKIRALCR